MIFARAFAVAVPSCRPTPIIGNLNRVAITNGVLPAGESAGKCGAIRSTKEAPDSAEGHWVVSGVQPGPVRVRVDFQGFKSFHQELNFEPSHSARLGVTLEVGATAEVVNVAAGSGGLERESRRLEDQARKAQQAQLNAPSQNVFSLQRKVAGILPVRVDVPRAGKSYRFVRPLVVGEETKITFQYRSR